MNKPTFTLTNAQTFFNTPSYQSLEQRNREIALREKYAGCVLKVTAEWREARFSDYSRWYAAQEVTVWDAETNEAKTFTASTPSVGDQNFTLWEVDATTEAVETYNTWVREVSAPALTQEWSQRKVLELRKKYDQRIEKFIGSLDRGSTWKIVRGRKFPLGTQGKLFWSGSNRWGFAVGLSTTDRKDERGRNLDVIFVNAANLERVISSEEQAKIDQLNDECAALQSEYSVGSENYSEHLANLIKSQILENELELVA